MTKKKPPRLQSGTGLFASARTPKGRRTIEAILDATFDLVSSEGLAAASQEAIATKAGVTQSALRHHFPQKQDLLDAFFFVAAERLDQGFQQEMAISGKDPRSQLLALATLHYDQMLVNNDVSVLESCALLAQNPRYRPYRDDWYRRMGGYYAELIQALHPDWDAARVTAVAFQVCAIVLGGWLTLGSSRPFHPRLSRKRLKAMLLDGVDRLIT